MNKSEFNPSLHNHPWGQNIFLSPEAKSKKLGKAEFFPLNFKELKSISESAIQCSKEDVNKTTFKDKTVVLLNISGFLEEQPDKDMNIYLVSIDVIVDSGYLYVHSYPKNEASIQTEQYYFVDLNNGSEKINKEEIVVKQNDSGAVILEILLPYTPNSVKKAFEAKVQNDCKLGDEPSNDQCCQNGCITM